MYQPLRFIVASILLFLLIIPLSHQAPQAWHPQGRFGKRAAWRPQSRFGKRQVEDDLSPLLELDDSFLGPKRAWRPQSRFGKRDPGAEEDLLSNVNLLEPSEEEMLEAEKKWKPQGRFGKRGDDEAEGLEDLQAVDGGEEDMEKRAWRPQSRFGKRRMTAQRLRSMINYALKRAWRPQSRFGKRSFDEEIQEKDSP